MTAAARALRCGGLAAIAALTASLLLAPAARAQTPDQAAPAGDGAKPKNTAKPAPVKPKTAAGTSSADGGVMRYPPSSVRTGLILGGSGVTLAAYGLGVMSARIWQDTPGIDMLYVPVAGPWIALGRNECSADNPDCGAILHVRGALYVLSGLAQLGGLGLIGEGIFMTTEADSASPKPKAEPKSEPKPQPKTSWTIAPVVTPTHGGIAFAGTF